MIDIARVFRRAMWPNPVKEHEPSPEVLVHYTESAKIFIRALIAELEGRKAVLHDDAHTWRSSGPEYQNSAESQEYGYNQAIEQLRSLL